MLCACVCIIHRHVCIIHTHTHSLTLSLSLSQVYARELWPLAEELGWARGEIQLAWDFSTASRAAGVGRGELMVVADALEHYIDRYMSIYLLYTSYILYRLPMRWSTM